MTYRRSSGTRNYSTSVAVVPTISHQGRVTDCHEGKARMLVGTSFPPPHRTRGMRDGRVPPAPRTRLSTSDWCSEPSGARKKSSGTDGIGPLAIGCVYDWDPRRVAALIHTHIRFGTHPDKWKPARVTIPKPDKDNYVLAKSHRATSLLNCLGKTVEKVAAMMVSAHCEIRGGSHSSQYGCRPRRSAVDAVRVAIAQTQEAWSRGCITGALLMDVASAFPSVARGCPLRKLRGRTPGQVD